MSGENPAKDPKYRVYLEEIASLFAQGLSADAVCRQYDIDRDFLSQCIADPEFTRIFSSVDPKAYQAWAATQKQEAEQKQLKAQINEDAPGFYKIVSDLVNNDDSSLTDRERCDYALKLASLSDAARKDTDIEQVILSEHQLNVIAEALEETAH